MGTAIREIRFALRRLRHSPGFTIAATLTLAIAIGATTAVFSVVDGVLLVLLVVVGAAAVEPILRATRVDARTALAAE